MKQWLLEFEPQSAPFIEPLMGWTGSIDPLASMQLGFDSRDAAIAYAERQGLEYEVRGPAQRPGAPERRTDHQPPRIGFSFAVTGMMIPLAVFSSSSRRRITTRSCNGLSFIRTLQFQVAKPVSTPL